MIHLGDITKIRGNEVPIVDCVIGGSPCQDLSIAGLRKGFDGERSVLFLDQTRIVKEMRAEDERRGNTGVDIRPRYMVWENVHGTFTSNEGEDFRCVLQETARIADENAVIPRPPKGKWTNAGCIMGDGWSIAWRVHDAQYWGTTDKPLPQRRRRVSLVADFGGQSAPEILFVRKSLSGYSESGKETRKRAASDAKRSLGATDCKGMTDITAQYLFQPVFSVENHPNDSRVDIKEDGIVQALTGRMGTGGGNVPLVMSLDRASFNQGKNAQFDIGIDENGIAHTVVAKGPGAVCYAHPEVSEGIIGTLDASYYKGQGMREGKERDIVVQAVDCRNYSESDINGALQSNSAHSLNGNNTIRIQYIVRRLTPLECERLQGFPDHWTDIGDWIDSNGKKRQTSDAARYKALGNSIAKPFWKWLIKRICAQYERDATMASLFDGIGGFPLIWEEINGKGSCLWASEVEDFPIAVTKARIK